jgi:hypothetical protein
MRDPDFARASFMEGSGEARPIAVAGDDERCPPRIRIQPEVVAGIASGSGQRSHWRR